MFLSLKYVARSNMLLVSRFSAQIVAFDADTAAFRGAIELHDPFGPLLVDELTHRLHVPVGVGPFASSSKVQTYDLDTFALVNETATYPLSLGGEFGGASWMFDRTRRLILRADSGFDDDSPTAWAVGLDSDLNVVAHVDFGAVWGAVSLMPSTVRDRTLAYLFTPGYGGSSGGAPRPARASLMALDATTLQPLANVDLLGPNALFESFTYSPILLTPPPPPIALAHTVTDRRVDLTWRDPGDATHFVVQVGSEPGRSNLATIHVGNALQFASEAPPGRYYVRVQALNDVGLSLPSNEVVVVVP